MIIKYLRYILIWWLIFLSGVTVVGLVSWASQPATTGYPPKQKKEISMTLQKSSLDSQSPSRQTKVSLAKKTPVVQPPSVFTATVILGWDIMLSRTIGYENKKQWYDRIFRWTWYNPINNIAWCKGWWCLLFFNLESQFSLRDNDVYEKTFIFKANTGNIAVLEWLRGKNTLAVSLANNHVNNAWWEGMATTRSLLDSHGIHHVWAGNSKEQAREIMTFKHNTITRCVWWYSYDGAWGIYWWKPLYWNRAEKATMLADLETMKTTLRCDIKAMMIHRWAEYRMKPNAEQTTIAHALVDSGLDLLIWAHSHVPGHIEHYKGKYIFYSLGNALFDQDRGMKSIQAGMDTIYDAQLGKKTVPTYITLFPEMIATKNSSGTSLSLVTLHTARLEKGLYSPNDTVTEKNLIDSIFPTK